MKRKQEKDEELVIDDGEERKREKKKKWKYHSKISVTKIDPENLRQQKL